MKLPPDRVSSLRPFYEGRGVCVTGGAGFIGGHLIDALYSFGARIRVIDDLSNSTPQHLDTLIDAEPERVRFHHASVLDDDALTDAMQECQTVFHLAAVGSVPRSIEHPQRSWSVNATGTLRVLEAAKRAKAHRVVYAASSSAYGEQPELPKVETQVPQPLSPYAASKLAAEHLCHVWAHCYGLSTASLRYFNVFGPRQPSDSPYSAVVAAFARRLLTGEAPIILGDGTQSRDFTFVSNAVLATLLAGATSRPLKGEVINVGTGRRTTVSDLAVLMSQACGVPHIRPVHQAGRAGDVKHSLADIGRARQLLTYEPFAKLEDGLTETVEWYKRAFASTG